MRKKLNTQFNTRQYMVSRDFEIYYYKDQHMKKVANHIHDYYEIYFFLEGDVSLEIEKKEYPLQYGDVAVVPPGLEHHAVIHDESVPYRRFVFWITVDYLNRLMEDAREYGYLIQLVQTKGEYIFHHDRIAFNTIQTKVFHLLEEIYSNHFGKAAKVSLCVSDLLLHLNRTVYNERHERSVQEEQQLSERLIDYIEEHLEEELSLDRMVAEFFVSKYHIAHFFKDHIGMSVHQYVQKKRLEACRDAIRNNMKISEAYLLFGFKDYSGFYKAFRKEYGMSPKEWQETVMNIPEF